jgi:hypothetical protein
MRTVEEKDEGMQKHREFFAQFVNEYVKSVVIQSIGKTKLLTSKDEHFNDIPLRYWDRLEGALRPLIIRRHKEINIGKFYSLSDVVCVAKEAARQVVEAENA